MEQDFVQFLAQSFFFFQYFFIIINEKENPTVES